MQTCANKPYHRAEKTVKVSERLRLIHHGQDAVDNLCMSKA